MNKPALQFSVTRIDTNTYHVVVQDEKEILRSYNVGVAKVMDQLGHELEQLRSMGYASI